MARTLRQALREIELFFGKHAAPLPFDLFAGDEARHGDEHRLH